MLYLLGDVPVSTPYRVLPEFLSLTDFVRPERDPVCPPEPEPPWKEVDMSLLLIGGRDLGAGRKFCARWMSLEATRRFFAPPSFRRQIRRYFAEKVAWYETGGGVS